MPSPTLTPELLAAALQGLEAQRARLDSQIAEVRRIMGAGSRLRKPAAPTEAPKRKRSMSAAGRRRVGDAARKRWAEYHRKQAAATRKAKEPAVAARAAGPKRRISAAARKLMADAARKRWAEYRRKKAEAVKKAKQSAPAKKAAPEKVAIKAGKGPAAEIVAAE